MIPLECKNCEVTFDVEDMRNENFCSDECMKEYQEENFDGEKNG